LQVRIEPSIELQALSCVVRDCRGAGVRKT
jgi:hypothetical protein